MSSATNSRRRARAGTTSLEFALVGSAFLLMLFGAFDVARYFFVIESLHTLVSMTARAVVIGALTSTASCPGAGVALPSAITGAVPILNPALLCVSISSTTPSGTTVVTIGAQYPFSFLVPAWTSLGGTLTDGTVATY